MKITNVLGKAAEQAMWSDSSPSVFSYGCKQGRHWQVLSVSDLKIFLYVYVKMLRSEYLCSIYYRPALQIWNTANVGGTSVGINIWKNKMDNWKIQILSQVCLLCIYTQFRISAGLLLCFNQDINLLLPFYCFSCFSFNSSVPMDKIFHRDSDLTCLQKVSLLLLISGSVI